MCLFICLFIYTYNDFHETISRCSCRGENGNDLNYYGRDMKETRIVEIVGKHNCECSCCHRRCAHLQLVEGYDWECTGALKQNITTQANHGYEGRFSSRAKVSNLQFQFLFAIPICNLFKSNLQCFHFAVSVSNLLYVPNRTSKQNAS